MLDHTGYNKGSGLVIMISPLLFSYGAEIPVTQPHSSGQFVPMNVWLRAKPSEAGLRGKGKRRERI